MSQRIFILGGGRFGVHLATRLCEFGCEVVIADENAERIKDLSAQGFHAIEMDVNDEQALKESGVPDADVVVVAIGENMQASILATLLLKQLQARKVVARALDRKQAQVLERLGADEVILPVRDMAYRLAERLRDGTEGNRQLIAGSVLLAEIVLGMGLAGRPFDPAWFRENHEVTPVLLKQADASKVQLHEPDSAVIIGAGDVLWVTGSRENLKRFERDCGPES